MTDTAEMKSWLEKWEIWGLGIGALFVGVRRYLVKAEIWPGSKTEKLIEAFRKENKEHRDALIKVLSNEFRETRAELDRINMEHRDKLTPILEATNARLTVIEEFLKIVISQTRKR